MNYLENRLEIYKLLEKIWRANQNGISALQTSLLMSKNKLILVHNTFTEQDVEWTK